MHEATSITLLTHLGGDTHPDAWREFDRVYGGLVRRWLIQQGVAANDADDICQEVMAVVLREIGSFEHSGRTGAFRHWLRKVTANRAREFWRARDRQRATTAGSRIAWICEQLEDSDSPLSRAWDVEHDQHVVEQLLESVSGRFAPVNLQAFRRVVLAQQDIRAVADDLQTTVNAIRVAQSRIMRALRAAGIDAIL